MITSRTPFRVSFAGGGTDLRAFYQHEFGAVTGTAIDKYIFITVSKRFDETIRASYSKTEIVDKVSQIQHPIIREAMILTGVTSGVEITSIADLPASTGVGSSSSFTVGLLNALYAYKGEYKSPEALAKEACHIEIDILGEPIGKQDQYLAAYGGLQHIQFNADETVFVNPVICLEETKAKLNENLLLFYTGMTRKASVVLSEQTKNTDAKIGYLREMKKLSLVMMNNLIKGDLDNFGELLHREWMRKKKIASCISNAIINSYYARGIEAGASGGKLLGAGGGGFLLFFCAPENRSKLRNALDLKEVPFALEPQGSKIIYVCQ